LHGGPIGRGRVELEQRGEQRVIGAADGGEEVQVPNNVAVAPRGLVAHACGGCIEYGKEKTTEERLVQKRKEQVQFCIRLLSRQV
jgi:hypothetical protein